MSVIATNFLANAGPDIFALAAPNPSKFTQRNFNVGSGVVSSQNNNSYPVKSISLSQLDTNGTDNIIAIDKPKLAPTFTLTIGLSVVGPGANQLAGLWITDGGAIPNCKIFGYDAAIGLRVETYNSYTSFTGDDFNTGPQPFPICGLAWHRLQETLTSRIYSISSDGINWVPILTQSNSVSFVTVNYGFAIVSRNGASSASVIMATMYHFSEDNP